MTTIFSLGFPNAGAPWAYQHTLGLSVSDVEQWWKKELPTIKQDIQNAQGGGLGPGNAPAVRPLPPPVPPSTDGSGTMILVSVLLVGGGLAGYYFYKKQQATKGGKKTS